MPTATVAVFREQTPADSRERLSFLVPLLFQHSGDQFGHCPSCFGGKVCPLWPIGQGVEQTDQLVLNLSSVSLCHRSPPWAVETDPLPSRW